MAYVDFFCLPLPKGNEAAYRKQAETFASVMKEHGLQQYCEASADDVPKGKVTDFYRAVDAKENETVVAAYAVWPDKATRDKAWDKAMKDPRIEMKPEDLPFDGKRMFWGGFSPIVQILFSAVPPRTCRNPVSPKGLERLHGWERTSLPQKGDAP